MVPFAYRLQCTWQWGHVFQQSPKWRFSSRPLPGLPTDDVRHRNGKYKLMSQGILRYWGCDWMSNRRSRTWKAMGMAACRFMVPFAYRLQCTWQWGHVFQQSPKWRFSSRPLPCLPTDWIFIVMPSHEEAHFVGEEVEDRDCWSPKCLGDGCNNYRSTYL